MMGDTSQKQGMSFHEVYFTCFRNAHMGFPHITFTHFLLISKYFIFVVVAIVNGVLFLLPLLAGHCLCICTC